MVLGVPRGFPLQGCCEINHCGFFASLRSHSSVFGDNAIMKTFPSLVVHYASWCDLNLKRAVCFVAVAFALSASATATKHAARFKFRSHHEAQKTTREGKVFIRALSPKSELCERSEPKNSSDLFHNILAEGTHAEPPEPTQNQPLTKYVTNQ